MSRLTPSTALTTRLIERPVRNLSQVEPPPKSKCTSKSRIAINGRAASGGGVGSDLSVARSVLMVFLRGPIAGTRPRQSGTTNCGQESTAQTVETVFGRSLQHAHSVPQRDSQPEAEPGREAVRE